MTKKGGRKAAVILVGRERYRAVVLQVTESDGRGPRAFRIVHEDETVKVQDEMAFWVVYASEKVLNAPKPN